MEYRYLGTSGLKVPALGFGAGTFGGKGPLFSAWGNTDIEEAKRLIDICLDAGVNLFDSADVYSDGASESILGAALKGRREQALISTKLSLRAGDTAGFAPPVDEERLYRLVDALDANAAETGRTVPQIALNWLLGRPTVSSVLIGARNEQQLRDNLGAVGWALDASQIAQLDVASAVMPPYPYYPYWNGMFGERNPPPVPFTVPTESPA